MQPYLSFSWRQALKEASYQLGHSVRKRKKKRADLTKLRDSFHDHHCLICCYFRGDRSIFIYDMICAVLTITFHQLNIEITGVSSVMNVDKDFFFPTVCPLLLKLACKETIINASKLYNISLSKYN